MRRPWSNNLSRRIPSRTAPDFFGDALTGKIRDGCPRSLDGKGEDYDGELSGRQLFDEESSLLCTMTHDLKSVAEGETLTVQTTTDIPSWSTVMSWLQ